MPATAGRVRMPANNRVHSSAALQTHGIWQIAIGYDPYAPNKDDSKNSSNQIAATAEPEAGNAYASFQGLLALARITDSNADKACGACKKCGRVGHLTFQCKNFLSLKESKEKDPELMQVPVLPGLDKLKGGKLNGKKEVESEEEEEESESESSDSDVDSEMERIVAERYGKKKVSSKGTKSLSKKKSDEDDGSQSDSDYGERKKRGRSKKRSGRKRGSIDSDDENESRSKRRKEKKRRTRDDEFLDEDDDDHGRHRKRKSRN